MRYYKFFVNEKTDIEIILTPCIRDHQAYVYNKLEDAFDWPKFSTASISIMSNGQKAKSIKDALGPYFIRVIEKGFHKNEEINTENLRVFSIKIVNKNSPTYKYSLDLYAVRNGGTLEFDYIDRNKIDLKWPEIYKESVRDNDEVLKTKKAVYLLRKHSENMNSIWGIHHAVLRDSSFMIKNGIDDDHYVVDLSDIKLSESWSEKWIREQDSVVLTALAYVNREGTAILFSL